MIKKGCRSPNIRVKHFCIFDKNIVKTYLNTIISLKLKIH